MGKLRFHQEFVVESSWKFSELTVVRKATEQDRVYTCRVSSTQQTFTTSAAWNFTVDLNVYGKSGTKVSSSTISRFRTSKNCRMKMFWR